jgi:hypothetical protein
MKHRSIEATSREVNQKRIEPAFIVRAVIGEKFAHPSYSPDPAWGGLYQTTRGALLTALHTKQLEPLIEAHQGKHLILLIEAEQPSKDTRIGSVKSVQSKLAAMVESVLKEKRKVFQVPLLANESDLGHLSGSMLVVDGDADADELCDAAVQGGLVVPAHGGNESEEWAAVTNVVEQEVTRLPSGYDDARRFLAKLSDAVREKIAAALEPRLNAEARNRPQQTYEEKKELAKWITAELRRFGLALSVEGTTRPCLIMANTGGRPGIGRFALYYTDDAGRRHDVYSPGNLPDLKLTLDEMARAPYGQRSIRER